MTRKEIEWYIDKFNELKNGSWPKCVCEITFYGRFQILAEDDDDDDIKLPPLPKKKYKDIHLLDPLYFMDEYPTEDDKLVCVGLDDKKEFKWFSKILSIDILPEEN